MTTPHVDDGKWNVWESDPKTGKMKRWIGSITNPKDAFEWVKKHGGSKTFRINNVPPFTSQMRVPSHEVYATTATDIRQGDALPQRSVPGKYENFVAKDEPVKKARQTIKSQVKAQTTRKPVVVAKQTPKTKAQKKLEADAKVLLDQHKADEQAEMEASDGS